MNGEGTTPSYSAEPARLRRLLTDNHDGITRYLGRLGVPGAEVDDVAQEVFLVAATKLDGVPAGCERAFLYACASRVAHNARRANVRRRRVYERYTEVESEPAPSPEDLTSHLQARVLVDGVLRDMAPELRGVFMLCEVEGLAVPEIARRLALPVGTASSRLRRAREAFFERLGRVTAPAAWSASGTGSARGLARGLGRDLGRALDTGPEILSWWVTDGEVDALRALLDIYRRSHPGCSVVHGGIRDTGAAKGRLRARMAEGAPPDTFQANGGQDLLRWARGESAGAGALEPLEFLFEDEQWRSVFPPDVMELVTHGGEGYAVPLNIHRTNMMLYDVQLLAKHDVAPPRTLDELHRAASVLRKRGVAPLAIGTRASWVLSLLAFENILVAIAGPAFYRDFFEGKHDPRAPELRMAIEELARLLDAANRDADRLGWDEATDRVRIGGAAMTIMGDWAKGYLERRGCLEGEHFAMAPTPGTDSAYVFSMDTFGVPRGAPHREGAIELLRVFGSTHGQSVFNRIKGSRPARSDVMADGDDPEPPSWRAFDEAVRVPTFTSLVPASFSGALDAALGDFARTRDVDAVMAVVEREYASIER